MHFFASILDKETSSDEELEDLTSFNEKPGEDDGEDDESVDYTTKQCILDLPSAKYIRDMGPGGIDPEVPKAWKRTEEHGRLYFKFLYKDYLMASG